MIRFILFAFVVSSQAYSSTSVGLGASSLGDGRLIPAIQGSLDVNDQFEVSGFSTGFASKAYYLSSYGSGLLTKVVTSRVGKVNVEGFLGGGLYYNVKGVLVDIDQGTTKKDTDVGIGPHFKVRVLIIEKFYAGFEFIMGSGLAMIGNGWGDVGTFGLGWIL